MDSNKSTGVPKEGLLPAERHDCIVGDSQHQYFVPCTRFSISMCDAYYPINGQMGRGTRLEFWLRFGRARAPMNMCR